MVGPMWLWYFLIQDSQPPNSLQAQQSVAQKMLILSPCSHLFIFNYPTINKLWLLLILLITCPMIDNNIKMINSAKNLWTFGSRSFGFRLILLLLLISLFLAWRRSITIVLQASIRLWKHHKFFSSLTHSFSVLCWPL